METMESEVRKRFEGIWYERRENQSSSRIGLGRF